jgi:hypothetical protein
MSSVECQGCGAIVSKTYARVFGDQDDALHSCSNCASQGAVASGAGAAPDGTPRAHRPGESEPVPAALQEETTGESEVTQEPLLESLLKRDGQEDDAGFTHEDQQFQQLVAEETAD